MQPFNLEVPLRKNLSAPDKTVDKSDLFSADSDGSELDDRELTLAHEVQKPVSVAIRITNVTYDNKQCKLITVRDISEFQMVEEVRRLTKMQQTMN